MRMPYHSCQSARDQAGKYMLDGHRLPEGALHHSDSESLGASDAVLLDVVVRAVRPNMSLAALLEPRESAEFRTPATSDLILLRRRGTAGAFIRGPVL